MPRGHSMPVMACRVVSACSSVAYTTYALSLILVIQKPEISPVTPKVCMSANLFSTAPHTRSSLTEKHVTSSARNGSPAPGGDRRKCEDAVLTCLGKFLARLFLGEGADETGDEQRARRRLPRQRRSPGRRSWCPFLLGRSLLLDPEPLAD